jgi:hypothetical protein
MTGSLWLDTMEKLRVGNLFDPTKNLFEPTFCALLLACLHAQWLCPPAFLPSKHENYRENIVRMVYIDE